MAPGWTRDEVNALRLCLKAFGVSAWGRIAATGLLPGKTTGQLSGQAQRLLGQQSLAGVLRGQEAGLGMAGREREREGLGEKTHLQLLSLYCLHEQQQTQRSRGCASTSTPCAATTTP